MSEIRLTEAQRAAVDNRGGALLVSAAAGSGKTKVLVDRLMARVCDPDDPRNINEFLMITYTKAAASELRGKISAELGRRLAAEPGNRHLHRQMSLIYQAEISTVHAFCANLLRAYAHHLDLPSDFRVAEENECAALRDRALEQALEQAYAQIGGDAQLRALVDLFGYGRDDRGVARAVLALNRAAQCHPYPEQWIAACRQALDMGRYATCADTVWGRFLMDRLHHFSAEQTAAMEEAIASSMADEKLRKAYVPALQENLDTLRRLAEADGWDEARKCFPDAYGRLKPVRSPEDPELAERVKSVRARCLDGLKEQKEVFYGSSDEVMEDLKASAQALLGAFSLLERMLRGYDGEKRRRRILDFADLEHGAVRLLIDKSTGRPTAAAREIAGRYCEIMVDEYQDSNEVQDLIFRAVSRDGRNRFLVGDVKQSIYRFRLADPTIFLEKYRTYADYRTAEEGAPRRVLLSENFRSRPEILEAVNHVFRTVMSERVGDLSYTWEEALRAGLRFPPVPQTPVELHGIEVGPEDGEKGEAEARFVASRIVRLLREENYVTDGAGIRRVRPEDIVILLRSVSSSAPAYLEALRAQSVACVCDRGGSVLDTQEVETLLALLQVIDNPHQDIPLAAALESPLFAFSADELGAVRAGRRQGDFYDALQSAAAEDPKIPEVLQTLQTLREDAKWMPLPAFVRHVLRATEAEAVYGAMADGGTRVANLYTFLELAVSSGKRTLAQFLRYALDLREQGISVSPGSGPRAGGAVTIMSIHKSKGLEFPVVILADLSHKFNTDDLTEPVLTHPALFAGGNVIDRENGVRYPTIAKKAIAAKLRQESLSEEMRVLYVAMTRAKDMLIMTYASRYLENDLRAAAGCGCPALPSEAERARCAGFWVLAAAVCRAEAGELRELAGRPKEVVAGSTPWRICLHRSGEEALQTTGAPARRPESAAPRSAGAMSAELVRDMLAFRYPYSRASEIPSKLTATQLKGRFMDDETADGAVQREPRRSRALRRPDFVPRSAGLSPAERGTANHLFLQFADYARCTTPEGVKEEVRRLRAAEFLTAGQAEAVRQDAVLCLFTSGLGERLLHAEKLTREFKFSILADAAEFYPDVRGERVMLQGVIDCFFEEEGGLTVLDFKTDAVLPGGEAERAEQYRAQITSYAMALERICGKPVRKRLLYFLSTGGVVEIL